MEPSPPVIGASLAPARVALQHRPRPLPLFLELLRERTAADPARAAAVMAGVRAYQAAERKPRPLAGRILASAGRATLRDIGGDGPPVVLVPSLINGPEILDLDDGRSLLLALRGHGHRVLLVDWGEAAAAERDRTLAGHVTGLLLPLLTALREPAMLVGYCLGGTLALAAAALHPVRAVALLAAPWHFSRYDAPSRAALAALWGRCRRDVDRIGLMPLDVLQAAFWALDPERTLDKFARFGAAAGDPAAVHAFVPLEDWANAGAPLTAAAAHDIFDTLIAADASGRGAWRVGGVAVDPAALSVPLLELVPLHDRIVPAAVAPGVGQRLEVPFGHVGMVTSARAPREVWAPLAQWLRAI